MHAVDPTPSRKVRVASSIYRVRRRIATGLAVVMAVFFGFHVMFGRNGINVYEAKRIEDRELAQQIRSMQQENERLQEHVERLKTDPGAIEHEAREKLHYARPDEVIYTWNERQIAPQGDPRRASDGPQAVASIRSTYK